MKNKNSLISQYLIFSIVITGSFLFFGIGHASAATYYMRQDGTAANIAASTGPCSTQANAMNVTVFNAGAFSPNDIIYVCNDGSDFSTTLTPSASGTENNNIILRNAPSNAVPAVLNASASSRSIYLNAKNYWTVDGLTIHGGTSQGFYSYNATGNILENSNVDGPTAVYFTGTSGTVSHVTATSTSGTNYAVRAASASITLSDVTVASSTAFGIYIGGVLNATLSTITTHQTQYAGLYVTAADNMVLNVSNLTIDTSGLANAGNGHAVYFDGNSKSNISAIFNTGTITGSKLEGFYIKNATFATGSKIDDFTITGGTQDGFYETNTNNFIIQNSSFHDNIMNGVIIYDSSAFSLLSNQIYDNGNSGSSPRSGVSVTYTSVGSPNGIFKYNNIYNNGHADLAGGNQDGIDFHQGCTNETVAYNIFANNGHSGIAAVNDSGGKVYNNTFYHNGVLGSAHLNDRGNLYFAGSAGIAWDIENNIVTEGYPYDVHMNTTSLASATLKNNNYFNSGTTTPFTINDGATSINWATYSSNETASIYGNPLFFSASDFHLQNTSPAINAGANSVWSGTPNITDYESNPITNGAGTIVASGGTVDIGAYEFQDSTPPTTTADLAAGTYNSAQTVHLTCSDGAGVGCANTYYTIDGSTPTTGSTVYSDHIDISSTTTLKFFSQDKSLNSETYQTNIYTIDTTPPIGGSFTINSGAAQTKSTNVTLNITCPTDTWTPIQMAYGNSGSPANWTTCTSSQAHTLASGDGTKTVYVRFEDGGGNATGDSTQTITLDTTPPHVSITAPLTGNETNGNTAITFTDDDPHSPLCSPDNSHWTACVSNTTKIQDLTGWNSVSEGSFTLYLEDTDTAGNTGTNNLTLTKDTVAPTITITNPTTTPAQSKTITASATESATLSYHANNSGVTTCDGTLSFTAYSSITFSSESDNNKTVCYQAVDSANNTSYSLSSAIAGIDTTAPTLAFTDDVAIGPTQSDTITADWGDSSVAKWKYNDDTICSTTASDYPYTSASPMTQTTETNNGKYLCLYGEDIAGNQTTLSSNHPINIDTTPPHVSITAPLTGNETNGNTAITFTDDDPHSPLCSPDNSHWTACVSNTTKIQDLTGWNSVSEGSFTLYLEDTDTAGNTGTNNLTLTKDTVAPTITITNPTTTPAQSKTITASATESATLSYHANNSGVTTCDGTLSFTAYSSITFSSESDNNKTVCYQAVDSANNTSYSLSSAIAGIDTTAPTLAFTDDVAIGPTQSDTITADWGDSSVAKWKYNDDTICSTTASDYPYTSASPMTQTTETNNGKYLCLYGEDIAGNQTTLSSNHPINIDTTPPVLSNPQDIGLVNTSTPSFTFNSTEGGTISYNGSCSSATTTGVENSNLVIFSSLPDGTYDDCQLRITDVATNQSAWLDVPAFTVDTTPPTISDNGSSAGELSSETTTATLSLITTEDAICQYSTLPDTPQANMTGDFDTTGNTTHTKTVSNLSAGTDYRYYVKCIDLADNITPDDFLISFSIASPASSSHKSHHSRPKKKSKPKYTTEKTNSVIHNGETITPTGKRFSKNSLVLLYFSKSNGVFYLYKRLQTDANGNFSVSLWVNKPTGFYGWYAIDQKTGKKSSVRHYAVR